MDAFAEDILPGEQPAIETSNVNRLIGFTNLIRDPNRRYPAIGTVTGAAGTGKTVAVHYYVSQERPRPSTWLPAVVKVKVKPRSTPKAFAVDLLQSMQEEPKGQNVYQVADEATAAITRNVVELIIVDEADRLTEESFDILRHIHDKSGCRIVVVGLPELLSVIDSQEKFASRVALRMQFEPLPIDEIHEVVLPQMVFRHWRYSPDSAADRELGERIWTIVRPSLRKLRNLLQAADQVAAFREETSITRKTIDEALKWTASGAEVARLNELDKRKKNANSTHEQESERRQEAKANSR